MVNRHPSPLPPMEGSAMKILSTVLRVDWVLLGFGESIKG